jgi:NCS1 family nucleobase:cation symporter-1
LHSTASDSAYGFWRGFNPIGIFSLAIGFLVYVAVFNPLSLEHSPAFLLLTASIPSCLAAGLCHLVLTRAFARRLGWGAYPERGSLPASPATSL